MVDDKPRLVGSPSSYPNPYKHLRAFARVVRTGTEEIEEHEFLRIELAVAWVQFEIGTSRAIRGEAFFRNSEGRVINRITLPKDGHSGKS
ncbi:MAG: hypothetical protein ACYC7A_13745 [Thermoanaerobaculia bacterium]